MARGISSIVLEQFDEVYAPPEQDVLVLSRVGDVVFISIGVDESTHDTTQVVEERTVAIHASLLNHALFTLQESEAITNGQG